ncbi:MAG: ribosome biogenesis GTPase Der [Melioribacteraceae bacterium]|nr:ribosome biogenesis GTPase Der [Melioribacteraceae bacterium]
MKTPLVVIVGRPNVGKSTLFNRLTKTNTAIVDDVSGVTRDRNYGEVLWNGKTFKIMDTGGYVPESDNLFEIAIKEQVQIAIEEADAIIFLTDGRAGITPVDSEIAIMLRKSSKFSMLLVNKVDSEKHIDSKSDFYKFGLEHVADIAAINGRNLGDVLDNLVNNLDFPDESLDEDERLKIAVLGRPNVGKSSLTNALLGYDRSIVTNIPGTTRDSINSVLKYYGEEIILVDTAGLRKKARVKENIEFYSDVRTFKAIAESDVSIVLIDAQFGIEKQDKHIIDEAVRRRKGLVLAVNKWDLIEKDHNTAREFEQEIIYSMGSIDYVPIIFISALTKQRIYKVIDIAKTVQAARLTKVPTRELNDTMLGIIKKTPPPASPTGKEVKIKYLTQVGDKYPIFLLFANNSKFIPDSYRRFIEKQLRANFGFAGVPMTVSFRDK